MWWANRRQKMQRCLRLDAGRPSTSAEVVWLCAWIRGRLLGAYTLVRALPQQRHAEWEQSPVRLGGTGGVYMCGDYRETASIQGALASGRRAAEAVIKDCAGFSSGR